jgi:hypothetical protein
MIWLMAAVGAAGASVAVASSVGSDSSVGVTTWGAFTSCCTAGGGVAVAGAFPGRLQASAVISKITSAGSRARAVLRAMAFSSWVVDLIMDSLQVNCKRSTLLLTLLP